MPREGSEVNTGFKPTGKVIRGHRRDYPHHATRHAERNRTPTFTDRLLVAGQVFGIGTALASLGIYLGSQEDSGPGLLFTPDEQRIEKVTTGQLFADAQLASVDSPAGLGQEKNTYSQKLDQAKAEMSDLMTPQVVQKIAMYEPLIRETAKNVGIPEDLFLGQAITESLCDPDAVSEAEAAGLFQIMPYLYEKYGIDPFDPQQNAELAAKLLKEEYGKFGDWSLVIWSWHIGDPQVYKSVQTYATLEMANLLPDIPIPDATKQPSEEEIHKSIEISKMYTEYIARNRIDVNKLFSNNTIRSMYEGAEYNRTWDYLPRIEASVPIYNSLNLAQATQQQ